MEGEERRRGKRRGDGGRGENKGEGGGEGGRGENKGEGGGDLTGKEPEPSSLADRLRCRMTWMPLASLFLARLSSATSSPPRA
eukprot:629556-Hanusia_phi.AAC.1